MNRLLIALVLSLTSLGAHAALILNVDTFNSNELSFSISGTFDADVTGDQKDWLALTSNWAATAGTNQDWIDDSNGIVAGNVAFATSLTIIEDTIAFNGVAPSFTHVSTIGQNWGDSFYWNAGSDILAGTTVSGTFSVAGSNIFDINAGPFQLASGFNNSPLTWARLEATATTSAVPEPGTLALLALGFLGIGFARRKA